MEKSDKPKDTIKMISRFNEERVMHRTSGNSYLYNPDATYMRSGFLGNGKRFIDPPGGPFMAEGEILPEADRTIKSIENTSEGYLITFDDDLPCNCKSAAVQ